MAVRSLSLLIVSLLRFNGAQADEACSADDAVLLQTRQRSPTASATSPSLNASLGAEGAATSAHSDSGRWFFPGRRRTPPPKPLRARVWAATFGDTTAYPWPEQADTYLFTKTKNVGIAVSGGGSRSYAAGYGQLRALHELGLLKKARYLVGTSGGGWVTAVYSYHQLGVSDDELLGTTPTPEELTQEKLADLPHTSLGWGATGDMLFYLGSELVQYILRGRTRSGECWAQASADAFLNNYGLGSDKYFTHSVETLTDILKRNGGNPKLKADDFLLPARKHGPYLVLPVAAVGPLPKECLLIPPQHANPQACASYLDKLYRPFAATPIYTGYAVNRGKSLVVHLGNGSSSRVHEGGLVETWAFGGPPPTSGVGAEPGDKAGQIRELEIPAHPWSLKAALGATSNYGTYDIYWYENGTRTGPGNSVSTGDNAIDSLTQPVEGFWNWNVYDGAQLLGQEYEVWDTSDDKPVSEKIYLGDGGQSGDYAGIHDLIARGVLKIINFYNTATPLCSAEAWDPATDQSPEKVRACISGALAATFGVEAYPPSRSSYGKSDYSVEHLQVFPKAAFAPFVKALQAAMAANKTAFTRMHLQTVDNVWRKIPAKRHVDFCLFYLSSSVEFEAGLPEDVRQQVQSGTEFNNFPYYNTLGQNDLVTFDWDALLRVPPGNPIQAGLTSLTNQQTNLLAGLTSWALGKNKEAFIDMFS